MKNSIHLKTKKLQANLIVTKSNSAVARRRDVVVAQVGKLIHIAGYKYFGVKNRFVILIVVMVP